jgi:hypothetical protein
MADYPPPIEDVPIFNINNFLTQDNGGGLTEAEIATKFLRFPTAQGTENLQTTSVAGLLTCTAGVEITDGDLFNKDNIIMNGIPAVNYIQFPDLTKQYTAPSSSGNIISTQVITTSQNIIFPPLTKFATIIAVSAGGQSGNSFFNGSTTTTGGSGGGGGVILYPTFQTSAGTYLSCTITGGVGGVTRLDYLPVPNTNQDATTTNIFILGNGGNGEDGTVSSTPKTGTVGSIKQNTYITGLILLSELGGSGSVVSGTSPAPPVKRGVNYLSEFIDILNYNVVGANPKYGGGGFSQCTNPSTGDTTYTLPASGVIIVVSFS